MSSGLVAVAWIAPDLRRSGCNRGDLCADGRREGCRGGTDDCGVVVMPNA